MKAVTYPPELPISNRRAEIMDAISSHQVLVVAGETGSGKSTQLPKMCMDLGRGVDAMIGHTQPRRIAARSVAERVAEELKVDLGQQVGFAVRFDDRVGSDTRLKVMTDGILLAEIQRDPMLNRYDTLIIDEAHERSLNIDFLLGYLAQLLPKRPDLKIIVTSATIDTDRFSKHFDNAPIIEVSGRTYPVEMRYRPVGEEDSDAIDTFDAVARAVAELCNDIDGDVLVFCAGERDIRDATDAIQQLNLKEIEILPLYARLTPAEQHRVFEPVAKRGPRRRVVVATNVAETSLTVPGIRSVVDIGTARISRYSNRTKVQRLPIEPVSQASADQRAGRCGRVAPGICIRLFSEDDYLARPEFTEPEIQRTNLASVILQMINLRLGPIEEFPFVDPPDRSSITDGLNLLTELQAIDPQRAGKKGWITPIGRQLARLPVDPRLGRMLVEADAQGCGREANIIIAALSIQDPRDRPADKRAEADALHARFGDGTSDFTSYLELWTYLAEQRRVLSSNQFRRMCRREFINHNRVREWIDVERQLRRSAKELGFQRNNNAASPDAIHQAVLSGLLSQVGMKDRQTREYIGPRGIRFAIAPGSALFKAGPRWVMAAELVETNRLWARTVTAIDPAWLERQGAHLLKRTYSDPEWEAERGSAITRERVSMAGLVLAAGRKVQLSRIDHDEARAMFIHHALVLNDWDANYDFLAHNQEVLAEVEDLEARTRRRDLVVEQSVLTAFFDRALPASVTSTRQLRRWWHKAKKVDRQRFELTIDDVVGETNIDVDTAAFPDSWVQGQWSLPVSYQIDGTSRHDGATIEVPVAVLNQLDPTPFEWNVPGYRAEMVDALVRSLPKPVRREFVPIPDTVSAVATRLDPESGPLLEAIRQALNSLGEGFVERGDLSLDRLPSYLRPTFQVVDLDGAEIASGHDLGKLQRQLHDRARSAVQSSVAHVNQAAARGWTFGTIERRVEQPTESGPTVAYPALIDDRDAVAVGVFSTPEEQADSMWAGTRRLVRFGLPRPVATLDRLLDGDDADCISRDQHQSKAEWYDDIISCAIDEAIERSGGPAFNKDDFAVLATKAETAYGPLVAQVAQKATSIAKIAAKAEAKRNNLAADRFSGVRQDVRGHLDRLLYPGVLTAVRFSRLDDVIRYLHAIERRLDTVAGRHRRDQESMMTARRLEQDHQRLMAVLGPRPDVQEMVWLLEEFRVALFAQELGTAATVSEQRLRQMLNELAARGR